MGEFIYGVRAISVVRDIFWDHDMSEEGFCLLSVFVGFLSWDAREEREVEEKEENFSVIGADF